MTVCGVCGRACTPMADHDAPTCLHCDRAVERILECAARIPIPAVHAEITWLGLTTADIETRVDRIRADLARRRAAA